MSNRVSSLLPLRSLTFCLLAVCLPAFSAELFDPQTPSNSINFETDEGSWLSLDVAPDGEHLVFELLGDLYQLPITGGNAKPIINGRDFASQPRFSPNGQQLVFVSDRSGEDNLWLANADGSGLIQLSKRTDGELISPAWSRDGKTIYVSQLASRRSMNANIELWAYPVLGGEPKKISTGDMGRGSMLVSAFPPGAYGPQPSANNSELFFTAASPRHHGATAGPRATIMKIDLQNGITSPVTDDSATAFKPLLSNDGNWLAFAALQNNKTGLKLRNLVTNEERWLAQDIGFNALESWASRDLLPGFAFNAANESLVIAYGGKIQQIDLSDGQVTPIPFNANIAIDVEPRVHTQVSIDQGPVIARLAKGATISPDGSEYTFSAFGRLYTMAIADEIPHKVTSRESFGEFHPAWSADGEWLTYVTWTAADGGALWKVPADRSRPAQKLTADGGFYRDPVWSPDGQSILAVQAPKATRLENLRGDLARTEQFVRLNTNGGDPVTIAPAQGAVRLHFSADEERFYAYTPYMGLSSWKLDGSDRKTHLRVLGLAHTAGYPAIASDILLSPDGQHALAMVAGQLYLIDMSLVPAEQQTVNVYAESASDEQAFKSSAFSKITTMGSDHFSWADAQTVSWSAGTTLYSRSIGKAAPTREVNVSVQLPRRTHDAVVALRGARIITMDGDTVIENGDLLIRGNRIQAVGEFNEVNIPQSATVVNMQGKTIMPGIVDIHAHWSHKRSVLDLENHNAYANLAFGVTSIRDPQSMTDDIFIYADAVDSGEMVGPRIFSTGRGVFFFNHFQSYEQVFAVLERYKKKYRTHLIKSYLPGSREVRQWVIRACRELDLIVTAEGGADAKMDLTFALDGFSGTEHAVPIVPIYKDIIQLFAQSGISYTPTLLVSFGGPFAADHFIGNRIGLDDKKLQHFMPPKLIRQRIQKSSHVEPERHIFPQVARGANNILESGGNVGLGGHGEMQGLQVHWEMWAMASGGMSNLNVLRVATLESAKAIGLDSEIGSIEVGKLADLVVMDSNPLDDISHTNSISGVMVNGALYDAHTLAQQWPQKKNLPLAWWQTKGQLRYD